jgi:glutamate synthase (NADPH) small chain
LAVGATQWRDLAVPGRELDGVHQAMEYLPWGNKQALGEISEPSISAAGKHVVIIGGGDTGADCLGTALRQGAASVTQLEILPRPSDSRSSSQPWPTYPMVFRITSAHEERGDRLFGVATVAFLGDGTVSSILLADVAEGSFEPIPGTERELPADLVLLAMGFTGPAPSPLLNQLELATDERGVIIRDERFMSDLTGVFIAGDAGRGQSLIVWAIAEGRSVAAEVDAYLTGRARLPRVIDPTSRPLTP